MQINPETAVLAFPGIIIGLLCGYAIGGMKSLDFNYRIGLGIIVSFFGGLITSLVMFQMNAIGILSIPFATFEVILVIISYFGGYALGVTSNWAPLPEKAVKRRMVFELDDDDEFDREIEEAIGGDFKANNS